MQAQAVTGRPQQTCAPWPATPSHTAGQLAAAHRPPCTPAPVLAPICHRRSIPRCPLCLGKQCTTFPAWARAATTHTSSICTWRIVCPRAWAASKRHRRTATPDNAAHGALHAALPAVIICIRSCGTRGAWRLLPHTEACHRCSLLHCSPCAACKRDHAASIATVPSGLGALCRPANNAACPVGFRLVCCLLLLLHEEVEAAGVG